eukprot:TRINITY_DN18248_c0_g1_i1.p1 TRINITY_DN18248_c0_g1~~TRINITY_DN18248_c0_g1_i1.p1  ORF type:complete len:699 (+),score=113.39 TRINITY_DN18248_c0_g1_i1:251-2098(+)
MDDDDLAENTIGGKSLSTRSGFGEIVPNRNPLPIFRHSDKSTSAVIPGPLPQELQIKSERIGVRLLRLMGWREGQGIGPRVFAPESKDTVAHFRAPTEQKFEFITKAKTNFHGLGFNPVQISQTSKRSSNLVRSGVLHMGSGKVDASSQGFGLGAFEDADDIAVYSTDNMNDYVSELVDEDEEDNGRKQGRHNTRKGQDRLLNMRRGVPCHDGLPPLRKFVLAEHSPPTYGEYPAPVVPNGWAPNPLLVLNNNAFVSPHLQGLDAGDRAQMLGEVQLQRRQQYDEWKKRTARIRCYKGNEQESKVPWAFAGKSADEIAKEKKEFDDQKGRFKQLSSVIADRFTPEGKPLSRQQQQKQKTSAFRTSETKSQGKLSRQEQMWRPERLLCKRFNVRPPALIQIGSESSSRIVGDLSDLMTPTAVALGMEAKQTVPQRQQFQRQNNPTTSEASKLLEKQLEAIREEDDNDPVPAEEQQTRPSIDLFKAIFENDGSDVEETGSSSKEVKPTPSDWSIDDLITSGKNAVVKLQERQDKAVAADSVDLGRDMVRSTRNPYLYVPDNPTVDSSTTVPTNAAKTKVISHTSSSSSSSSAKRKRKRTASRRKQSRIRKQQKKRHN